jgi:hypothetical protein
MLLRALCFLPLIDTFDVLFGVALVKAINSKGAKLTTPDCRMNVTIDLFDLRCHSNGSPCSITVILPSQT